MSSYAVTLTYSPARDVAGPVLNGEALEQVVTTARGLAVNDRIREKALRRRAAGRRRGALQHPPGPAPEYGTANITHGLASRAFSGARTPGELREVNCVSD